MNRASPCLASAIIPALPIKESVSVDFPNYLYVDNIYMI